MKKIAKLLIIICISIATIFSNINHVNAASASISVSSSTSKVVVGNTFTVTIKISSSSNLGAWEFTPSYNTKLFKMTSGESPVVAYADGAGVKSKTYTYKLNSDREPSGIGTRAISDLQFDYSGEMSRKYCQNASLTYDSRVPQVLCDGKDILKDANIEKIQKLNVDAESAQSAYEQYQAFCAFHQRTKNDKKNYTEYVNRINGLTAVNQPEALFTSYLVRLYGFWNINKKLPCTKRWANQCKEKIISLQRFLKKNNW